jgi:hypothetical protein
MAPNGSTTARGTTSAGSRPVSPVYGTVDLLADYPFDYGGVKYDVGLNIHNLLARTYYTVESRVSPLVGLGGSYGGRIYGDHLSILGHTSGQFPGSPKLTVGSPAAFAHDTGELFWGTPKDGPGGLCIQSNRSGAVFGRFPAATAGRSLLKSARSGPVRCRVAGDCLQTVRNSPAGVVILSSDAATRQTGLKL